MQDIDLMLDKSSYGHMQISSQLIQTQCDLSLQSLVLPISYSSKFGEYCVVLSMKLNVKTNT